MPACKEMTIDERRRYLKRMVARYQSADRGQKGALLGEMEAVTALHRKSIVRLLRAPSLDRQARGVQRGRTYGAPVMDVVRVIWESLDYVCAQRLTPSLVPTARHLAGFGEVQLTTEIETLLTKMARPTVQRMLTRLSQDTPRLPRRGPEQTNHLAREIPMGRVSWETATPGYFEVDLVHHSGPATNGEYVHSLQMIDVATGWSERVAVLGRGQRAMEGGFRRICARLPFPIRHLHPDNGSEFLNDHLVRYWGEQITGVTLSRSRPWHKNDNRFVEQKNDTLIRAYLGHERLDRPAQCDALNRLYEQMWVYYNLFQPVLHLVSKEVVESKVKRRWDAATSPYQRLMTTGVLTEDAQSRLATLYTETNPRQLRRAIYAQRDVLWDTAPAVHCPG